MTCVVGRTVRQTGNLGVIIFGGGLFVLLTLSLTTELFARNSPSVLYSQAVDKIRASDAVSDCAPSARVTTTRTKANTWSQLNPHLLPPLTFTHSPTPAAPVRGSTPVSHTFVRHPSSGRDHMIITFWVHGRGRGEPEPLHWAKSSWHLVLSSLDDVARYTGLVAEGGSLFTPSTPPKEEAPEKAEPEVDRGEGGSGWLGSLLGGFSGLRSTSSTTRERSTPSRGLPPPGTYKVGEVKGDYVKVSVLTFVSLEIQRTEADVGCRLQEDSSSSCRSLSTFLPRQLPTLAAPWYSGRPRRTRRD